VLTDVPYIRRDGCSLKSVRTAIRKHSTKLELSKTYVKYDGRMGADTTPFLEGD
jgi:hypothetical protein